MKTKRPLNLEGFLFQSSIIEQLKSSYGMTRRINPMLQAGQVILYWMLAWSCILAIPSLPSLYPSAPQESVPRPMLQGQTRHQQQQQHRTSTARRHDSRRTMGGSMDRPATLLLPDGSTRLLQVHTFNGREAILLSSGLSSSASVTTESMSTNDSKLKLRTAVVPQRDAILVSPSPQRLAADETTEMVVHSLQGHHLRGSTIRYITIPVPDLLPTGWYSSSGAAARAMGVLFIIVCFVIMPCCLLVKRAMDRNYYNYKLEVQAHQESLAHDIAYTKSPTDVGYGSFHSIWEGDLNKFDI
jgi:hypothetical protein